MNCFKSEDTYDKESEYLVSLGTSSPTCHGYHFIIMAHISQSGPSCSKLLMSLVNDLLKITSSDTQIC